jgi:hypothetical protein
LEGQPYFRFDIELTPERNPPGLCDRLREDLRAWIVGRGLGYGMGALGGSRDLYGQIGPNPPATEGDRAAMAEWLRGQRMHATVRLEAVVPFSEAADMLAPITDWVFAVDTLTEAERADAAAYHAEMRRRVEALRAKHAEPSAAADPARDSASGTS